MVEAGRRRRGDHSPPGLSKPDATPEAVLALSFNVNERGIRRGPHSDAGTRDVDERGSAHPCQARVGRPRSGPLRCQGTRGRRLAGSVAEVLGISQATVSRLAARVKSRPASLRPTVAEVLNRAAAKEISRARMLRELQDLRVAYVKPEEFPDSNWALLRRAVQEGALTHTDARKVAEDTVRRFVARVTASMDLEGQTVQEPAVAQMLQEAIATGWFLRLS